MMRWNPEATSPSDVAKDHDDLRRRLEALGDFSFLDELPDDAASNPEIPFPYGSPKARPYGWFSIWKSG